MIIIYSDCKRCFKGCIHTQCPNYELPKASHYCSICDEGIYPEEEYIGNQEYFDKLIYKYNKNIPKNRQIAMAILRDKPFIKNSNNKILRNEIER